MPKKNEYSSFLTHEENGHNHAHSDSSHGNTDIHKNHNHDHKNILRDTNAKVLAICIFLTTTFAIIESIGGYLTNSVTLASDAIHMLTDAAGLVIAFFANKISRKAATVNLTFGYGKAEAVGALINCIFTTILTFGLLFEVIKRFFVPVEVGGLGILIVASCAVIINIIISIILYKNSNSLNMKAALIHALGDLFASFIAIIAGVTIYFSNFYLADPILSLIMIFVLIQSNYTLIKKSLQVLMSGIPEHLNYEQIGKDLEEIDGVISVHDLHIWYISANTTALSAHVITKNIHNWQKVLFDCQKMLGEKHNIEHVTLQHEYNTQYLKNKYCEIL